MSINWELWTAISSNSNLQRLYPSQNLWEIDIKPAHIYLQVATCRWYATRTKAFDLHCPPEIILLIAEDDSLEWEDLHRLRHVCPVLFDELGFTIHVTIRLQKPYWDYYIIRRCSSMLRNPKVTLEIDLDEGAWSQVPQHHRPLLMAMVEFSITGVQLEKDLEDQRERLTNKEERYLLRHGCMPVRSLKVVHCRQTENTQQQWGMRLLEWIATDQQTTAMDGQPLLSRMEHLEGRYRKDEQRS